MAWTNKKTAIVIGLGAAAVLVILLLAIVGRKPVHPNRRHHPASWALTPISKEVTINLQPDGSVLFEGTIEETNATPQIIRTDRDTSDSEKLTRITDAAGNPMILSKRSHGYLITLNQPVPPGGTVSYAIEGQVKAFLYPDASGVCRIEFASSDANISNMRCVEVWRLPAGAILLKKDEDMEANTNAGQIELRIEKIVPPKGWLKLAFKYRLPPNVR